MTPHRGKNFHFCSSQQLPRLLSQSVEGLLELTRLPSRALYLNLRVASGNTEGQGRCQVCPVLAISYLGAKHVFEI